MRSRRWFRRAHDRDGQRGFTAGIVARTRRPWNNERIGTRRDSIAEAGAHANRVSMPMTLAVLPFRVCRVTVRSRSAKSALVGRAATQLGRLTCGRGRDSRSVAMRGAIRINRRLRARDGTITEQERVQTGGAGSGTYKPVSGETSAPNAFEGAASVILTPDRRFLFATNGGDNSVSSFRVDEDGRLTPVDVKRTGNVLSGRFGEVNGRSGTAKSLSAACRAHYGRRDGWLSSHGD